MRRCVVDKKQEVCDRGKTMQEMSRQIGCVPGESPIHWLAYHVGTLKERMDQIEERLIARERRLTRRRPRP